MIKNCYFGTTHSETLQNIKHLSSSLTRDLEWLKEVGVDQMHIDKLNTLIQTTESTGTFIGSIRGKLNCTSKLNKIKKQIIDQTGLLNDSLTLNSDSGIAVKRTLFITEVKKAGINEFAQKATELVSQLKSHEIYFGKEDLIAGWCVKIENMVTEYIQTYYQLANEKRNSTLLTHDRTKSFAELIGFASSLARVGYKYWRIHNDQRYRDYKSFRKYVKKNKNNQEEESTF